MTDALIQLTGVTKVFDSDGAAVQALRGIDLEISKGEMAAITGESGSGKSTLLAVMGGIAPPTSGRVVVDSIPVYGLHLEKLADFRREYIGFVFQQFHLIPYLNTLENVMLPLAVTGIKEKEERALRCLERVGLKEKARRLPSRLSGGEQQRVAIARALVNEPPVILADEPTGNLDTATGREIFNLFCELNGGGQTVIIVTHNPEIASGVRRTVVVRDGRAAG